MSIRRLATNDIQPAAFKFNRANAKWAKDTIRKYPKGRQASAVIPLLMRAQEQDGWVTKASIEAMADMLDMPYVRVLEVATFYTQFQLQPVGTKAHIQVCGTTPCMLRGAGELIEVCKNKINANQFVPNAQGSLSWEEVECQGACVNAPMIMVFKDTYEDLTPERLGEIIDEFEAGRGSTVKTGPQIDRIFSAPIGGPTVLTDNPNIKKTGVGSRKKPPAKKPATKKKTATTTKSASLNDKNRPKKIKKPKQADDLKLISGIGPKIETTLQKLGIFLFSQIADWKKPERDWVDGYLNFKGRIERDEWIKQAKVLAKGGHDE